jgi:hypothetical protein
MARYLDYADTYLPGEAYSAGLEDYQLLPQAKLDYRNKKKFKFNPSTDVRDMGESFQTFLALQNNPERLFTSTARMPQTPFGNFSTFL